MDVSGEQYQRLLIDKFKEQLELAEAAYNATYQGVSDTHTAIRNAIAVGVGSIIYTWWDALQVAGTAAVTDVERDALMSSVVATASSEAASVVNTLGIDGYHNKMVDMFPAIYDTGRTDDPGAMLDL